MKKILIAMSGGVDSSVAAFLLKKSGYRCSGAIMKLHNEYNESVENKRIGCYKKSNFHSLCKTCCSESDASDARSVAFRINIPFFVFDFVEKFKELVIDNFVKSYQEGITPNPCIECNKFIKFVYFLNKALQLESDYIATGHYARIEYDFASKRYLLKKSLDQKKDQSYVLYCMTQEQLKHTIFPLGDLFKTKVREIAETQGFLNSNKRDSQDICFVPNGNHVSFINKHTGKIPKKGKFINSEGKVFGEHNGIINYTVGQRRKIGISWKCPLYVCSLNAEKNVITLGSEKELYTSEAILKDINLISIESLNSDIKIKAKIRYRHEEQSAKICQIDDEKIHIEFNEPQRAITKGQSMVFYVDEYVIGGGVVC
ncbi:MAG: tRNA 2-thiouridine(34) synthase MnmA [Clostridiales bacterium]|jgi:tRNA-specific 2-thiouridylase|nr:tRNA 2-thiouridine(34) synthase MnmA [Clostridiales bacterium]